MAPADTKLTSKIWPEAHSIINLWPTRQPKLVDFLTSIFSGSFRTILASCLLALGGCCLFFARLLFDFWQDKLQLINCGRMALTLTPARPRQ